MGSGVFSLPIILLWCLLVYFNANSWFIRVECTAEKKLGRKFGGLGKMYYLCTRNSKERVFGGVWRFLSGEQVLTIRELFVSLFC